MATLEALRLARIVLASMAQVEKESTKGRAWSEAEDQFLRDNLAWMTDAEIGQQLGRSETAVHLRWSRDLRLPSRSKNPEVITAHQAARMLGIDEHKTAHWVDMGLIPGRLMPGDRKMRLIKRQDFRRWVLNPMNWPYFNTHKITDPELKRMLKLRAARWGDEWWTARQVADYHNVDIDAVKQQIYRRTLKSFHLPVSLGGRNVDRGWSNHFILKSVAVHAIFLHRGDARMACPFTTAADRWLLKARDELGMTFVHIGRTMKIGKEKIGSRGTRSNYMIGHRYHLLKANQKTRKSSRS
jgi:hypothetical protein